MARLFIQAEGGSAVPRELNWGLTRIGRGSDNDIVISHPSISYHHCEFELGLDFLILRDCDSTNGTFVGDQKIKEVRLEPGQTLRFGQVNVTFEWSKEQVVVPEVEVKRAPESVDLGDGMMSCRLHVTVPSAWHCQKCEQFFCTGCTRDVHLVGRPSRKTCSLCGAPVERTPWADGKARKQSIWGRVKRALSRTMRVR
jgi:hypothetical protein